MLDTHAITFVCNSSSCNSDHIKISPTHEITIRLDDFDDHIEFKDSVIPQILRVVVSVPENINNFIATGCAISTIHPMAFKQLYGLYTLNLAENHLTSIEEKHFSGLGQLRWMFLSHNKIHTIQPNAFKSLPELEYLNLSTNSLESLDKRIFMYLKKVEAIYLDHNQLTVLPRTIFERNRNLRFLDVSYNQIQFLHLTFHDSIFMLNAAFNHINSFQVDFKSSERPDGDISILRLENNRLNNISNVTSLNLSFELSLANNMIAYHSPDSLDQFNLFNGMRNLWSLNISNTGFHFAHTYNHNHDNPFGEMSELKELDLSYNDLRTLDLNQVRVMELRTLQLNGNNLTELNIAPIRRVLPNLRALEISDNKFNCTYLRMFMHQLNQNERLEINVRDDLMVRNTTHHVNGVGCIETQMHKFQHNLSADGDDKVNEHDMRLKALEDRIEHLFTKLNEALELQHNFAKVLRNFTRTFEYGTV
uniref:CSON005940 protein n=1 Tax=Culicoides sonorensis TaxID=179676 RepID=A0A336MVF9_CULSO